MGIAGVRAMGAKRYQDLVAWQLANELKNKVYELLDDSATATRDRDFTAQIKDAASSGPANIAEGFGAYRHREAARYARIGRSSLIETQNHLGDGADRKHWSREAAAELQAFADRAIGATTRWVKYLTSTDTPGPGR
jgi:four helix bundle protein